MIDSDALARILAEAGRIALDLFPRAGAAPLATWDKGGNQPVCEADIAVDRFLRRELTRLLPAAGWLSEETADDPARLERDMIWLVDPIDGTRDFIRGRPGWAISVALIRAGRPLLAFLEAPARAERWEAVAGRGARRNGAPLSASRRETFAGARVPAEVLMKEDRMLSTVAKPNSIALRIAMVAADEADLVATLRWGNEWDIAAAALIAREAGAVATDAHGEALGYNKRDPRAFGLLVSAPAIHADAVRHLAGRARGFSGT